MWLTYDTRTGEVLDGPQTSSAWPGGAPDREALVNAAEPRHTSVLRLHDETDAEEVAEIMELATTHELRVEDGTVVAGDPLPPPEPEPEPDQNVAPISRREMVRILEAQGMTQQEAIDVVTGAAET